MKILRIAAALSAAAFAVSGAPATAEANVPAACGTTAPVVAEGEQLVERTLYFHGESTLGDVDGFQGFAGGPSLQTMDGQAPTAAEPKVDTNSGTSVYPATLPGNPIMSAWHTYFDETTRIACFGFTYWAASDAGQMSVQLHPDPEFIVGVNAPVKATATGAGAGVVKYSSAAKLPAALTADSLYAQIEADTPAAILYDAKDYPSSVTLVTIERAPVAAVSQ